MFSVSINYFAVIISALVPMVVGFVWYGPLFGKKWLWANNVTPEQTAAAKNESMAKKLVPAFIAYLVMSYVLAQIIAHFLVTTIWQSILFGIVIWLGLSAVTRYINYLWSIGDKLKNKTLFFFDAGYFLVSIVIMSIILSLWK